VIELDGSRVLEHVSPPLVAPVLLLSVTRIHHLVERRNDRTSHQRELVVDETSVESGDEGTYEVISVISIKLIQD
jgi:hypothetical protein